jgi:hypothetical protein
MIGGRGVTVTQSGNHLGRRDINESLGDRVVGITDGGGCRVSRGADGRAGDATAAADDAADRAGCDDWADDDDDDDVAGRRAYGAAATDGAVSGTE